MSETDSISADRHPLLQPKRKPAIDFSKLKIDANYVLQLCRKYSGKGISDAELKQLAVDGIYKAIERYDPSKSAFQTYATMWIKERILQKFKDLKKEGSYVTDVTGGFGYGALCDDENKAYRLQADWQKHDPIPIPSNLATMFIDHIIGVSNSVLVGNPPISSFYRMLSSRETKVQSERDIVDRKEIEPLFKAVVSTVLTDPQRTIYLLRFGAVVMPYHEIAEQVHLSMNSTRILFDKAVKSVVQRLGCPMYKSVAINAYRSALQTLQSN